MREVQRAFDQMAERIARLYSNIPTDQPFDLNQFPQIKAQIHLEMRRLAEDIDNIVLNGIEREWMLSNTKNDDILNQFLTGPKGSDIKQNLPERINEKWRSRNIPALRAFMQRRTAGMNLSDRVWNTVRGQTVNIERHLAVAIHDGTPASTMAGQMKRYLRNPDALFRRVRNAEGELMLSAAAKAYHPGRGVYRSAYKNALRLTRTETNRAYQRADNERWKEMDFVTGVRVQRSNAPYDCDICAAGVGDYPKDYEWDLFHPNCRCRAIPIVADDDEVLEYLKRDGDYEFSGKVEDIPDSFKDVLNNTNYTHHGH